MEQAGERVFVSPLKSHKELSKTILRLRTQKAVPFKSRHKEVLELKRQVETWTADSNHGQEEESETAG